MTHLLSLLSRTVIGEVTVPRSTVTFNCHPSSLEEMTVDSNSGNRSNKSHTYCQSCLTVTPPQSGAETSPLSKRPPPQNPWGMTPDLAMNAEPTFLGVCARQYPANSQRFPYPSSDLTSE